MEISIRFISFIKFETGLDEISIRIDDGSTIRDLIEQLEKQYGEKLLRFIRVKDSGKVVSLFVRNNSVLKQEETLYDGDALKIMPSVGGG